MVASVHRVKRFSRCSSITGSITSSVRGIAEGEAVTYYKVFAPTWAITHKKLKEALEALAVAKITDDVADVGYPTELPTEDPVDQPVEPPAETAADDFEFASPAPVSSVIIPRVQPPRLSSPQLEPRIFANGIPAKVRDTQHETASIPDSLFSGHGGRGAVYGRSQIARYRQQQQQFKKKGTYISQSNLEKVFGFDDSPSRSRTSSRASLLRLVTHISHAAVAKKKKLSDQRVPVLPTVSERSKISEQAVQAKNAETFSEGRQESNRTFEFEEASHQVPLESRSRARHGADKWSESVRTEQKEVSEQTSGVRRDEQSDAKRRNRNEAVEKESRVLGKAATEKPKLAPGKELCTLSRAGKQMEYENVDSRSRNRLDTAKVAFDLERLLTEGKWEASAEGVASHRPADRLESLSEHLPDIDGLDEMFFMELPRLQLGLQRLTKYALERSTRMKRLKRDLGFPLPDYDPVDWYKRSFK